MTWRHSRRYAVARIIHLRNRVRWMLPLVKWAGAIACVAIAGAGIESLRNQPYTNSYPFVLGCIGLYHIPSTSPFVNEWFGVSAPIALILLLWPTLIAWRMDVRDRDLAAKRAGRWWRASILVAAGTFVLTIASLFSTTSVRLWPESYGAYDISEMSLEWTDYCPYTGIGVTCRIHEPAWPSGGWLPVVGMDPLGVVYSRMPLAIVWFATLIPVLLLWPERQRGSQCLACDYDLTGNLSGVCPECGAAAPRTGWHR